jgi:hypothetical protein
MTFYHTTLRPVADYHAQTWTIYPVTPTTHYTKIDEDVANGDTDYITATSTGRIDRFSMQRFEDGSGDIPDVRRLSDIAIDAFSWYYTAKKQARLRPL